MTKLCFIDTETTSLDDRTGEVWEVALIVRTDFIEGYEDVEYLWQLPIDNLELADPMSLKINNFHDRRWNSLPLDDFGEYNTGESSLIIRGEGDHLVPSLEIRDWAKIFVELTRGAHFIANVPSFDDLRLRNLLRKHKQTPMWHYHLVCVENLIAGRLGIQPPWASKDLSEAVGVPVPEDQHGAMPDTRWTRDMYDAVFNSTKMPHDVSDDLNTAIGEAIGEASMCWIPSPTGIFDSSRASRIVDDLLINIKAGL